MRSIFLSLSIAGLATGLFAPLANALDGKIVGLSPDVATLELYKTPDADDAVRAVSAAELSFPMTILGESDNGMYKIKHNGTEYWVITDDVNSTISRKVHAACEPKMAGTIVAHGKRGVGEECK